MVVVLMMNRSVFRKQRFELQPLPNRGRGAAGGGGGGGKNINRTRIIVKDV